MGQVSLKGLRKSFGAVDVIRGIDLEIRDGEFMVFVGPSGCGKSTTLRMIAGLESVTSGDVAIDGARINNLHPAERGVAMVFQSYALYPHMTVAENMGFALKMDGVSRAQRDKQVHQAAEILRMTDLLQRFPKELSGGQRQRVAIGRAIVRKPKVFLFDEPLSNLDAALRVDMRVELARLHADLGTTMIYVTHDQVEAMTLGDRIAVFNHGAIEQLGAPLEIYNQPATGFVAGFIGAPRINILEKPAADASAAQRQLWDQLLGTGSGKVSRAGLRPEHWRIAESGPGVPAQVVLTEHLGDSSIIHLKVEGIDSLISAKVGAVHVQCSAGQMVRLEADSQWSLHFCEDGRLMQ